MKLRLALCTAMLIALGTSASAESTVVSEAGSALAECAANASAHSCSCSITSRKQVGASNNFEYKITCTVNGKECKQTITGSNDNSALANARNFCGCD